VGTVIYVAIIASAISTGEFSGTEF
jgi:hypothetical protein